MGMADSDVGHFPARKRRHQRLEMRFVVRAGVDHRHRTIADDIAVGAVKGERPGIVDGDALHAVGNAHGLAMRRLEVEIEVGALHTPFPGFHLYSISMNDIGSLPALTTLCAMPASRR
ncbi:hypothetical protein D3C87_1864270 [compost metagenome]